MDDSKLIMELASRGYVSLSKCCGLIGVSYPTILKLRNEGKLICHKVGGVYRVYDTEIRRFLEEGNKGDESEGSSPTSTNVNDKGDS